MRAAAKARAPTPYALFKSNGRGMMRDKSKRKKHLELLRSSKVHVKKSRLSNTRHMVMMVLRYGLVGVAAVVFIIYGIPYFSDVFSGVNPAQRYEPKVSAEFNIPVASETVSAGGFKADEIAGDSKQPLYTTKNDPYWDGDNIIFSTITDRTKGLYLNAVVLFNIKDKTFRTLPNVERKYDNILETKLSGNYAVWVDSLVNGGGRVCAYDLQAQQMFVVKEYAYAIPDLSVYGDYLAFRQVAGADSQKIFLYNLKTRENVTVRMYNTAEKSAGDVSLSGTDLVWSEYSTGNLAQMQRLLLQSPAEYRNPDFGSSVYGPKTNGKDIVFASKNISDQGNLMLSANGGQPVQIAQNPVRYEIGTNYVVYMKEQKIYVYGIDNTMKTSELTSQATRGILASINGNKVCFYDTTDAAGAVEIVRFIDLGATNG